MHDEDIEKTECRECEQLLELLGGYFDGELTAEVRHEVMMHAMTCDSCTRLLHSLRRLVAYCRVEPTCDMPGTVRQELWIAIRREIEIDLGDAKQA